MLYYDSIETCTIKIEYLQLNTFRLHYSKYEAADKGNKALKATHGMDYTIGCIPCLLCKLIN